MRDGRHCGGLDQGRGMGHGARNPDGARPPGLVGSGAGGAGVRSGIRRAGLDRKLGHRPPVMGGGGCGRLGPGPGGGLSLRRARRGRVVEKIPGRHAPGCTDLHGQARRHPVDDGVEQLSGSGGAGAGIDLNLGPVSTVEHGEPGVEARAPAGVDAAVHGHGEHHAGGRVEAGEGVVPVGVAGNTVGRGDGHEPAARRQHGEGRAQVPEVRVVADAADSRRGRERRVHDDNGGPDAGQAVGGVLGVHAGHHRAGEEPAQERAADGCDLVEMEVPAGPAPQRAFRHDRQHAGARRRLQYDVTRPDGRGLQRRVGERQGCRELLEADLLLGAPGVGRAPARPRLRAS